MQAESYVEEREKKRDKEAAVCLTAGSKQQIHLYACTQRNPSPRSQPAAGAEEAHAHARAHALTAFGRLELELCERKTLLPGWWLQASAGMM